MSALVFDAGALIGIERHDRALWAILAEARERGTDLVVPASVLAEAWRGGPRSAPIARLLDACTIDSLDEARAKDVGVRLGGRGSSDVPDAHVVSCALERKAVVATSDSGDLAALCHSGEPLALVAV
jgi:hypothetical protein